MWNICVIPVTLSIDWRRIGSMAIKKRVVMIGDFPRNAGEIGGGVESVMLYLREALVLAGGIDLVTITLDRWGLGARTEQYDGGEVHYVQASRRRGPLTRIINARNLCEKIKEVNPSIVHAHIAGHYSRAAELSGFPYILTLHGIRYLEANLETGLLDRYYRRHIIRLEEFSAIRAAKYVISINPFITETFGEEIKAEMFEVPNPVSNSYFDVNSVPCGANLLYVGRITPRKDLLTLLEAFQYLVSQRPDAKLRIAGAADNPDPVGYERQVTSFVQENGLSDSVCFLGNLDESSLLAEYALSSLCVMSSVLETAPMAISQGMAAGRPVVSTDAGGSRHMIEQGVSGYIVPIQDSRALGAAILSCCRDDATIQEMGRNARQAAVENFAPASIASRTRELYEHVLVSSDAS